jgi:hypothetical protein
MACSGSQRNVKRPGQQISWNAPQPRPNRDTFQGLVALAVQRDDAGCFSV